MKIQITKEAKNYLTLKDLAAVKAIRDDFAENKEDFSFEIELALSIASGVNLSAESVLKATAEAALNDRIYNYYNEESGHVDIWLRIKAYDSFYGFYDVNCYLSDIWQAGAENKDEIKSHMYIRHFSEDK